MSLMGFKANRNGLFCDPLVKDIQWFKEWQAVAKHYAQPISVSPDGTVLKSFRLVNLLDVSERDKILGGCSKGENEKDGICRGAICDPFPGKLFLFLLCSQRHCT